MNERLPLEDQVAALETGSAFADLSMWRVVRASGSDARGWLNDLLSAELTGLFPGTARRSLLLSPTGRIRALVTVTAAGEDILMLQDPVQDTPIDRALAPYVLSSDVVLKDATADVGLLAYPGAAPEPAWEDARFASTPSVLGAGADVLLPTAEIESARSRAIDSGMTEAGAEAVEAWRIRRGHARVGVDLGDDGLPQEANLDDIIGYRKGCFLGQEAVAKIRNLGHPPFVLLAASTEGPLSPGDPVRTSDTDVGLVTSADTGDEARSAAIVRVRWAAREAELEAPDGRPLEVRGMAALSD